MRAHHGPIEPEQQHPPVRQLRVVVAAADYDATPETTDRLQDIGGEVVAAPVRTPWQSLNSRLNAPAGLQITLFQELLPARERAARPGFDTGH